MQNIRAQIEPYLSFEGENAAVMVNNLDWTEPMSAIDFLRDVGKHFRVNRMIAKDAVAARLNSEQGISLHRVQLPAAAGPGLPRAVPPARLHAAVRRQRPVGQPHRRAGPDPPGRAAHRCTRFATPLLTKADGTKFGKTEGGALWLDPELTSPYAFFQFWLNTDDADVVRYLKVLSFRSREEIEELEKAVAERPQAREAQRALAEELTALVHGEAERDAVVAASQALFGRGELADLDGGTLAAALAELPSAEVDVAGSGVAAAGGPARRHRAGAEQERGPPRGRRGRRLPQQRAGDRPRRRRRPSDLLHGRWLVLRRGKRNLAAVRVRGQ